MNSAAPTPAGTVTLTGPHGRQLATGSFPSLAAPVDLMPKTAEVKLALPPRTPHDRLTVSLSLAGQVHEVTAANNQVETLRQ
ncbi:MAG: hypothetical protein ACTHMG_13775 [Sphingomonas sp.]